MVHKLSIKNIISSIDNLLIKGKEENLKEYIGEKIKESIFTDDIVNEINKYDFTGMIDEEDIRIQLFESIFPIFIEKENVIYRLHKYKIEVDLSNEMSERYIYMFSDGRLISGTFESYNISDMEYVSKVKKIIDVIPLLKKEILITLKDFKQNIDKHEENVENFKERDNRAEKNYNELNDYLKNKINT